jgi:hypothetical protein
MLLWGERFCKTRAHPQSKPGVHSGWRRNLKLLGELGFSNECTSIRMSECGIRPAFGQALRSDDQTAALIPHSRPRTLTQAHRVTNSRLPVSNPMKPHRAGKTQDLFDR